MTGVQTCALPIFNIFQARGELHMVLRNPHRPSAPHHSGNGMALANIRERLALHFDEEGRLTTEIRDGHYQVHIRMPCRREGAP